MFTGFGIMNTELNWAPIYGGFAQDGSTYVQSGHSLIVEDMSPLVFAMSGICGVSGRKRQMDILINTFTEDSVAKDGYYIDRKNDEGSM